MTTTPSAGTILKTDSLARVRTPVARRKELLEEFDRSGLSGAKFAALAGLKYSTFAAWVGKRKRSRPAAESGGKADGPDKVRWLEAVLDQVPVSAESQAAGLTVQWGSGARMEIADGQQVALAAALLRALEKPSLSC